MNCLKKFGYPLSTHSHIHKSNDPVEVYAITLPAYDSKFISYPNMPIEYLYGKNILDQLGIKLKKMPFNKAVGCCNYDKDENIFNTDNSLWSYELCDDKDKKRLSEEIVKFDSNTFENFRPLFNLIEEISNFL